MPTPTAGDIVRDCFKKAGILGTGQTLDADDLNSGFIDLNDMLAQWQRKRWLIWHLVDKFVVSTGQKSYTIGSGQNFDVMRPDRLEHAYVVQLVQSPGLPVSFPLRLLQSHEDYADVALKDLGS